MPANDRQSYLKQYGSANASIGRNARIKRDRRRQAIAKLGGKCIRCGYCDDWRALELDHIQGDGHLDGKTRALKLGRLDGDYRGLKCGSYSVTEVLNGSARYQLLCCNCNRIKKLNNREGGSKPRTGVFDAG